MKKIYACLKRQAAPEEAAEAIQNYLHPIAFYYSFSMNTVDTQLPLRTLPMARFSRSESQAYTQLVQRVRDCELTVASSLWRLTLSPMPDTLGVQQNGLLLVKAHWAGAGFCLLVPVHAAQTWIQSRFEEADLPTLPHAYLAMMLEAALADVCTGLAGLQRGAARIDSANECTAADFLTESSACLHAFEIRMDNPQGSVLLHLATDSLGLMLMAGLAARLPVAVNAVPADALPVLLRAEIGFTWLAAADFEQAGQGDTILLAHAFIHPDQRLWLSVNERWGLMVKTQASIGSERGNFEVVQALDQMDLSYFSAPPSSFLPSPMTPSNAPAIGPNPGLSALDTIAFRLTFDLGERVMTLGEIKALQTGQPLTLDRPLSRAVNLRVNGMLVGQGELVEIDGRLGVTVTALAGSMTQPLTEPAGPASSPDLLDLTEQ